MKKAYAVVVLTFIAVLLYNSSNRITAHAQAPTFQQVPYTVHVHKIDSRDAASVQVRGQVLGFFCTPNAQGGGDCFVATTAD